MPYGSSIKSTEPSINASSLAHDLWRRDRHANRDVCHTPEDRDEGERREGRCGQAERELTAACASPWRRHERESADAECQRGKADERCQSAPDNEQKTHEIDVGKPFGWRAWELKALVLQRQGSGLELRA